MLDWSRVSWKFHVSWPSSGITIEFIQERNKKDKFFNDIISFLSRHGAFFNDSSELKSAKKLVHILRDILWYVNSHHHVFQNRALALPSIFSCFTGYNTPQLSKHRKRLTCNISADQLHEFALNMSTVLQSNNFWERPQWIELKPHFVELAESLSSYGQYLTKKAKRMKLYHKSPTSAHELSSNLKFKFIVPALFLQASSSLEYINHLLQDKSDYQYETLMHFLPSDSVQKHRFMDTLFSIGLSYPCVILVYSPGSNIGNQVFAWKVPEGIEPSLIFERSQAVIVEIKRTFLVYHSRAMKIAMFRKFGLISSSVKPAVLCYFYKDLTG